MNLLPRTFGESGGVRIECEASVVRWYDGAPVCREVLGGGEEMLSGQSWCIGTPKHDLLKLFQEIFLRMGEFISQGAAGLLVALQSLPNGVRQCARFVNRNEWTKLLQLFHQFFATVHQQLVELLTAFRSDVLCQTGLCGCESGGLGEAYNGQLFHTRES